MITYDGLFIAGSWTAPSHPELLDIRSPHDRTVIGRAAQARPADIDRAVAAARAAFDEGPWPRTAPADRIAVIRRLDALRAADAEKIAALISAENGSAGWFTLAGQPGLGRQAGAYLKAAEEFGWEETLTPADPDSPPGAWCAASPSVSWRPSFRGTPRSRRLWPRSSPHCWPGTRSSSRCPRRTR